MYFDGRETEELMYCWEDLQGINQKKAVHDLGYYMETMATQRVECWILKVAMVTIQLDFF